MAEIQAALLADANQNRGEMVLVLHAAVRPKDAALSAQAQHIMQILTAELPTKPAAVLAAQISGENKKALYDWALVQKQDKGN